jgi:hypothetical protein
MLKRVTDKAFKEGECAEYGPDLSRTAPRGSGRRGSGQ